MKKLTSVRENGEDGELTKEVSKFYDEYHKKRDRQAPGWMKMYWGQFQGSVLEIGAGKLTPDKRDDISEYLVVEISPVVVRILKESGINALVANGEDLPFQANMFDVVACHDVLEHTPNPEEFISGMCRVSRNKIIIMGPNYCGEEESIMRKRSNLLRRTQNILKGKHEEVIRFRNPHFTYNDEWESDLDAVTGINLWWIEKQLEKNGFEIISSTTFIGRSNAILGRLPFVKYAGSMMFVVGRKVME
ncbi:MAG: class I SAM-dependent methyltransferase [Bacteroidales bacterium]|nr:class I SAM-dependent methyltransferase [Bacteroidales bacterium]